jgi:DNA-binding LacI/PurR family transcriptional regulator
MVSMLKGITKQDRIVNHFKSLISSGVYTPGALIPPEITLASEFGVNRGTVNKALAFLASSGLLVRKQGCGTFVSENIDESLLRSDSAEPSSKSQSTCSSIAIISYIWTEDPNYRINPFGQMFAGIEDSIAKLAKGCRVSFINTFPETKLDSKLLASMKNDRVSGIIYMAHAEENIISSNIDELKNSGLPFVVTHQDCDTPEVDMICISQSEFGYLAAKHLLAMGHKDILYVLPDLSTSWIEKRIAGFKRALLAAGLEFSDKMIFRYGKNITARPDGGRKEGHSAAEAIMRKKICCTGIMAVNDAYASGMIDCFRAKGIDVPGKISIVGTDDDFHFRGMNITTVNQPNREMGEAAVSMLLRKVSDEKARGCYEKHFVKPRFMERSTTARVNG